MRGFPPVQIAVVIIAFLLLSYPLWKLTYYPNRTSDNHRHNSLIKTPTEIETTRLTIRCAHAPLKLELVTYDGTLSEWNGETSWPQTLTLDLPHAQSYEIGISAQWPDTVKSTAVTLELSVGNNHPASETLWSTGPTMENVFNFNTSAVTHE